ncbi:MAG: M1 family aminopeptidase [Chitinophagaceae bacterium]
MTKTKLISYLPLLSLCTGLLVTPLPSSCQNKVPGDSTNKSSSSEQVMMPVLTVQPEDQALKKFRGFATKINDLVNTRLAVSFDYAKRFLYGKAWITLKPHFYPTDSLTLDAKEMKINSLEIDHEGKLTPLQYTYNGMQLRIRLDHTYTRKEKYTLFISYISRPEIFAQRHPGGSAAITDDKGLYFINPDGKIPGKPIQIWTQGETQSSSVWFPTIDRPDQKTTEEISMTVPDKYVTLSNGVMISKKEIGHGMRTDTWQMKQPNAPYLFMMAVGDFAIVRDHYKNIPVDYYVEKKYAPYARDIFGHTPDMIAFYSRILGVPYPWPKYDQIVVRDYVSGAMENTSATLHGEFMNRTDRQILDNRYNYNEDVIAHELFHQWFGDLVTCDSWSNITVNESFADFSESLWAEHEYGKDAGDDHSYKALKEYFAYVEHNPDQNLVRFHYKSREDVFDPISYQKGGRILEMLRNEVGDSAFFKSLHLYLVSNAYGQGSAAKLRQAFQAVTGRDLHWFWNQWYYGKGFPILHIHYHYDDASGQGMVMIHQVQQGHIFQLPFAIDVYSAGLKKRYQVTIDQARDTFRFTYTVHPDLVNVDADKILLAKIKDDKTIQNYIYQYFHAPLYLDRREAINACAGQQDSNVAARNALIAAIHDKYHGLRILAMQKLHMNSSEVSTAAVPELLAVAKSDPRTMAMAEAIHILASLKDSTYLPLFEAKMQSRSYAVQAAALTAINDLDSHLAYLDAKELETDTKGPLTAAIAEIIANAGGQEGAAFFQKEIKKTSDLMTKFGLIERYALFLANTDDSSLVQSGVKMLRIEALKPENFPYQHIFEEIFSGLLTRKSNLLSQATDPAAKVNLQDQMDWIQSALTAVDQEVK